MSLVEKRQELLDLLQENLGIVVSGDPVKEIGATFELIAAYFQAIGICNLLLTMDPAGFYKNLLLSGLTRRYYLKRSQSEGNVADEHLAISRNDSFFDAIAVGHLELALEIGSLSPQRWIPDGEYEDDFCYYFFCHNFVAQHPAPDPIYFNSILERFEKSLEGDSSPRLKICQSFHSADAGEFAAAFQKLLDERQQYVENVRQFANVDLAMAPRRAVFVEGLALIYIAELLGFPTEEEYEYCPKIARRPSNVPLPIDIYVEIERVIQS